MHAVTDTIPVSERRETFPCFGSECTVIVADGDAENGVALAKRRLLEWHHRFSRFEPDSELSSLNADPRPTVPVSPLMRRLLEAVVEAADSTGGLVDATLVGEIERAGYDAHFDTESVPLAAALALAPPRAPARPSQGARWREISVDRRAGEVTRPPGVKIDSGGLAKGVFADELSSLLSSYDQFAIDCAGDIRLGGRSGVPRQVHVASPFEDATLHTFEVVRGGVATSGIGKRSWIGRDGRPAHHLLDPATGRPAFTGIVQVTALAPTATQAEILTKATILAGPEEAESRLAHGGVVVFDDGSHRVVQPPRM
jgi:thiamine biosynthesis lipoprotein